MARGGKRRGKPAANESKPGEVVGPIQITELANGGEAVGRHHNMVVFATGGAPGDLVEVEVTRRRRTFLRGRVIRVLSAGPRRRTPPCPLAETCGGCQWQHVDYEEQLAAKTAIVRRALGRFGVPIEPVQAAPEELGYRRRVRLHLDERRRGEGVLGYRQGRSHRVVPVTHCPVLVPPLNRALEAFAAMLAGRRLARGSLVLVAGERGAVQFSLRCRSADRGLRAGLQRLVDEGVVLGGTARVGGTERFAVGARGLVLEQEGDSGFSCDAATFVQVNGAQNQKLRQIVAAALPPGAPRVLELFAGAGNFTRDLLAAGAEVVAVESGEEATLWLRRNLESERLTVRRAPSSAAVEALDAAGERFDLALLDPPREGFRRAAGALARLGLRRLIYVSCDAQTLARDLAELQGEGFAVSELAALDLMPQTSHVEAVVRLDRP